VCNCCLLLRRRKEIIYSLLTAHNRLSHGTGGLSLGLYCEKPCSILCQSVRFVVDKVKMGPVPVAAASKE
jgi:hypothetical protein